MMQMQSREKQQPFFKPLSNGDSTINNNIFEMRQKSHQNAANFQMNRIRENEVSQQKTEQNGTERLSSLHAKLHQEADKIRKWKVQTEIEIKQKEKKIHEANLTVETLRKSVLDLQLQNESLNLKLQSEIANREEIFQRISATRDMCNLLKSHSAKTEETLVKCEAERTELKHLEKDHLRQYEELSLSFRNLEITAAEAHNRLMNGFTVEKEEWESAEKNYKNTITSSENKLSELMNQIDEKDIEIRDIRMNLQKNDETIHKLNCTIDNYKSQFSSLQEDLEKKQNLLKESREQVAVSEEICSDLEKKLTLLEKELQTVKHNENQLQTELETCQHQCKTETDLLKNINEQNNNDLIEQKERVSVLQKNLEKSENMIEELKSARDILIMERSELENKEAAVQQERNELKFAIEKEQERISELESTVEKLQVELSNKQEECLGYETTVESLKSDIETLEDDKKELEEATKKVQEELKRKLELIGKMEKTMDQKNQSESRLSDEINCIKEESLSVRAEYEAISKDLETKLKDIEVLKKELKDEKSETSKLHKDLKKAEKREANLHSDLEKAKYEEEVLKKEMDELQREILEKQNQIDDLSKEKADLDQEMHNEIESKVEAQSELETKMKTLKDDLSTKAKLTKDLEKEIRALKKDLTSQNKLTTTKEKEINKLKTDLDNLKEQKEMLDKQQEELKDNVEQYKKIAEDSETQAKQMNKKCTEAVKHKEEAVNKCDHQMAEMMATLEKYQQENHKIVTQKDKEIEQLKLKLETESSSNKKENKKMSDLENEIMELQTQIQTLEKENISIKKTENDNQLKMNELITMQEIKESEIQELHIHVENLKSKEGSTIGVQTSPVLKNGDGSISTMSTPKRSPAVSKLSSRNKTVKEVAPMTPKRQINSENSDVDLNSPAIVTKTPKTPKTNYSMTNIITKTPQMSCKTPSADIKTPQRSILRQNSSCSSSVKKRRVAFMSESKQFNSDSDSDSSTSELMEVEMNQVSGSKGKKKDEKKTLYVRPSPKARTPDTMEYSDDEEKEYKPKGRVPLNPVPRGPPVSRMEKKQDEKRASWEEDNLKQYNELYPEQSSKNSSRDTSIKKVSSKTPNIRKTPSRNQGKFFKTSPKDRPFKSKLHSKKEELNWFDMDSVFGFGPED